MPNLTDEETKKLKPLPLKRVDYKDIKEKIMEPDKQHF